MLPDKTSRLGTTRQSNETRGSTVHTGLSTHQYNDSHKERNDVTFVRSRRCNFAHEMRLSANLKYELVVEGEADGII